MKWSLLFSGIFLAYMGHSLWTIYSLFYPEPCPPKASCMTSFLTKNNILEMRVCFSKSERPSAKNCKFAWANDSVDTSEDFEIDVIVNVPLSTRKNGTLWVHAFVMPKGEDPWSSQYVSQSKGLITTYAIPQSQTFNLMGDDNTNHSEKSSTNKREYVSHWRSRLTISIMTDEVLLNRQAVPMELFRFMRVTQKNEYLPLLYIDNLSNRMRDLMPLNESVGDMPLVINYRPISFGKLRLWCNMEESLKQLTNLGFTEKDTDEVKGIFADTNFFFLMLTFVVAAFHLLFDFLAFKNDISYWQERKSMIGLSTRTVVWRSVSTFIIFLYLLDEETSLLVLIPAGVGTIIEFWKVTKAFKVKVTWSGWKPSFELGAKSKKEQETENFDSEAMKYLSYLLIPLLIGLAVYSLMYTPHKSWYSWIINCLVNGIYAFGFVFMLPQLFLNYKLKSVAHLPWRAFMYKAFNTFIDDVFAFIITMPTAHRLACFRDDIVFVIYLYQRWLYPVDKKRVNEYGQSFTENEGQGDSPVDGQIEAKKIETKKTK